MMLVGNYLRLSRPDRRLARQALLLVARVRLLLPLLSLPRLERHLSRVARRRSDDPSVPVERIAWSIAAAARRVPGATCLVLALAGQTLMARHGYHGELRLGVMRDSAGAFGAHAWVEYEGRAVIGDEERAPFTPLPRRI